MLYYFQVTVIATAAVSLGWPVSNVMTTNQFLVAAEQDSEVTVRLRVF